MTGTSERGTGWSDLDAARLLLEKLGVRPADMMAAPARTEFPLIADYIPLVEKAVTKGTRRVYSPYWAKVVREWGHRHVNEPTALEISQLAEQVREGAVQRRNARGGRGAAEHLIGALRCMYGYLVADGILTQAENPAARAAKPRRLRSARMALPDSRLDELCRVASTTGNDPALDALLLRLHMETACRRGGALALAPDDLDPEQCLIRLREKGETVRWQPVSPTLMRHLLAHGESRGGLGNGQRLLRYANGRPITKKRYELSVAAARRAPRLGRDPPGQHVLDQAHHTDLGRAELRLRRRRSLRRPRGQRERSTLHGRHGHLRPGRPARGGDRPRRPHRRTPPAGHQRPRHRPRRRMPTLILARLAARTARTGPHPHPSLRPPWCYRHDSLVMDRRSTATARSCFHTQASLSRSVIGSAARQGQRVQADRLWHLQTVPGLASSGMQIIHFGVLPREVRRDLSGCRDRWMERICRCRKATEDRTHSTRIRTRSVSMPNAP